jgi:hypothetical protein
VVIVQQACRPEVSQRDLEILNWVGHLDMLSEMRRVGCSGTCYARRKSGRDISQHVKRLLDRGIPVEGSTDIVEEHVGHVSGADLDHAMSLDDESTCCTDRGVIAGLTDGRGMRVIPPTRRNVYPDADPLLTRLDARLFVAEEESRRGLEEETPGGWLAQTAD